MVTKSSNELDPRILARLRCSKSPSTTVLPEITFLVEILEYLCDAFGETNGVEDDSGFFSLFRMRSFRHG